MNTRDDWGTTGPVLCDHRLSPATCPVCTTLGANR